MEQRLSLITLGVDDIARSRRFYERLGWTASKMGGDEVAFFQLGGIILSLWESRVPGGRHGREGWHARLRRFRHRP